MTVAPSQRWTASSPCPICGGHEKIPRGKAERCYGFASDDGAWAHCTRAETAGGLLRKDGSETYAHKMRGECGCGALHSPLQTTNEPQPTKRIVATYDYCGADGDLRFQEVRYSPKDFKQRRPDGRGGWIWNLKGVELVLYSLPALMAADRKEPVYIVEGPKDADRLIAGGLAATTNPMGAKKWRSEYNAALRDRHVVILATTTETAAITSSVSPGAWLARLPQSR